LLKRLKGLWSSGSASGKKSTGSAGPVIVPAEQHNVEESDFSRSALKVLRKLHEAGHASYLVGGGVRDALVGLKPKDFDIATDASPETVRKLFRNSRIIGRRFKLVHVVYGREIIEVATFRAAHTKGEGGETVESGRIVRDNVYGSIEEDAYRRDFSVNALYYNIADGSVVDYVGGLVDLDNKLFRLIGDPMTRCAEDPVRVLRAVRLAAKLEFGMEAQTLEAMQATSNELGSTPPARLFEEVLKLFQGGYASRSFADVREHDLLQYLFPWPDVEERAKRDSNAGMPVQEALRLAGDEVIKDQLRVISIPRRFSGPMREIWHMQPRLETSRGERALRLMEDRRFRAAYDFLCLRSSVDPRLEAVAQWWTDVQRLPEDQWGKSVQSRPLAIGIWGEGKRGNSRGDHEAPKPSASKKKRRRRRRRKPGGDKKSPPANT